MSTVGKKLLCSVVRESSLNELLRLQLAAHLFREGELELFEFIQQHVAAHGVVPQPDTIESKMGDVMVDAPEPPSYYLKEVEKRFFHSKLKTTILQCQDDLKKDDPEAAFKFMADAVTELFQVGQRTKLYDFREAADLIYTEYAKQFQSGTDDAVYWGWATLDHMTNGGQPGDFNTINGRPAMGKTFMLLHSAHNGWSKQAQVPMFVSMEMAAIVIQQRLAAMNSQKSLTQIMKGILSTKAFQHVMGTLEENKARPNPFWVIDSNLTSTVQDIVNFARQLKPDSIWIDGAYLLKHPNARMGKFERIGENAELLKKHVAGECEVPVFASYQLNREVTKKKKNEKPGVEDIYGNDAMGQLSTVSLGLFQEESIETKRKRHVEIMKGRNGETGGFDINWNFMTMDFSEAVEPEKEELQFMG